MNGAAVSFVALALPMRYCTEYTAKDLRENVESGGPREDPTVRSPGLRGPGDARIAGSSKRKLVESRIRIGTDMQAAGTSSQRTVPWGRQKEIQKLARQYVTIQRSSAR